MSQSNGRPPTSVDVARRAGVSQSAVSRAFTPGASVSAEMRRRIAAAAAELGYRPSRIPAIMRSARSDIVAVVVGGFYNPYHAMALEAFGRTLAAHGKQMLLVQVESDRAIDEAVDRIAGYSVDAVMSALAIRTEEAARQLSALRIPVVLLNCEIGGDHIHSVVSDNVAGGHAAGRLLLGGGARKPGYISGPEADYAQDGREEGFARAIAEAGMAAPVREQGGWTHADGYRAAMRMFSGPDRPDALFCANDLAALGAMDALRRLSLSAPADVRIVGYDNVEACGWPGYRLTSFDQQLDSMAETAVRIILGKAGDICTRVPPLLVERESSGMAMALDRPPR